MAYPIQIALLKIHGPLYLLKHSSNQFSFHQSVNNFFKKNDFENSNNFNKI